MFPRNDPVASVLLARARKRSREHLYLLARAKKGSRKGFGDASKIRSREHFSARASIYGSRELSALFLYKHSDLICNSSQGGCSSRYQGLRQQSWAIRKAGEGPLRTEWRARNAQRYVCLTCPSPPQLQREGRPVSNTLPLQPEC
jgi:hypothetical protein